MTVDVTNDSGVDVDLQQLAGLARFVLDRLTVHPLAELSVMLVDRRAMATYHERFMDEPGPTDVLAFPMDELGAARSDEDEDPPPTLLGDVMLCPQVAAEQARTAGHSTADELALLCVHGTLHLLGYDHHDQDEERRMFALQDDLLAQWRSRDGAT
jgi:probable rRNA maturation factor